MIRSTVLATLSAALFASSIPCATAATRTIHVTGTGVDELKTAIVHSKVTTPTGIIQRSTESVELHGDLTGRVLYHVTTVIDFAKNTLTNTGDEVYSGTIAGSEPVLIHDDQFRFTVDLAAGVERGDVYMIDQIAGPKVRCTLHVAGPSRVNADGNPIFAYYGDCTFRGESSEHAERKIQ
jgi:hypothetical protein